MMGDQKNALNPQSSPEGIDSLDEILDGWFMKSQYQLKAALLKWRDEAVITELERLKGRMTVHRNNYRSELQSPFRLFNSEILGRINQLQKEAE